MRLEDKIERLSDRLLGLDAGQLAELRRIEAASVGTLAYWRVAAECGFIDDPPHRWMPIARVLAILTPKGDRQASDRLHDSKRRLGAVLCDGGAPGWPGAELRPFLSETRLGRLLATPFDQRDGAYTRIARMLAAVRDRAVGVDCCEIAAAMLFPDGARSHQKIAQAYYRRLDAAAHRFEAKEVR